MDKFRVSGNRRKVMANVFWAVLGKTVNLINALLVGVMLARYLGPDQFGLMNYVISYVMLFSIFAAFGLDNIEIRELSKKVIPKEIIMGTAVLIRFVFAAVAMLFIWAMVLKFESDTFTRAAVMTFSFSLMFLTMTVIRNYFTSIILNEYVVKTEILRTLVGAAIKIGLLLAGCSLTWFIVAITLEFALVSSGYIYSYQKKGNRIQDWEFQWPVARMLLKESFPLLLSGTAAVIYQRINAVMVRNMMGNESAGEFAAAAKIAEFGIFIPAVISQAMTPLLINAHQKDAEIYKRKRQQFMDLMVWSAIGIAAVTCLLASPAIRILYGQRYLGAIPVLQIMAWRTVGAGLVVASGQVIITEHIQNFVVIRNILGCVVSVALNFLLIPIWGTVGSAVALLIAMLVAGYGSHLLIAPYRFLVPLQTRAILFGWKQLPQLMHFKRSSP